MCTKSVVLKWVLTTKAFVGNHIYVILDTSLWKVFLDQAFFTLNTSRNWLRWMFRKCLSVKQL